MPRDQTGHRLSRRREHDGGIETRIDGLVGSYGAGERIPVVSGAADGQQDDPAVVWREPVGLDHVHAVFPDVPAWRVTLCTCAGTTAADARGGRDSPGLVAERRGRLGRAADPARCIVETARTAASRSWRIVILLATHVGLPYFLLSASAPLVQAWYSRAFHGRSPYRFYALSNVGSLTALLSYPFVIEPAFDLSSQSTLWSCCFTAFAILSGGLALVMARWNLPAAHAVTPVSTDSRQGVTDRALPAVVAAAGVRHDEPAGRHESDLPGRGGRAVPVDCCR